MQAYLKEWRWFRWHLVLFVVLMVPALWVTWNDPGTYWPAIGWSVVLVVHFLIAKTLNVDDDWGEARAYDLRQKTYDHKHINQVVDSAVDGDPDDDPAAPRRH